MRSGKLKKPYPTVRKNIGVTPKKTYPLVCALRRGMLKGMLTPCVRIASDPPCFYCSLPSAWKGWLCPIWVPGLCFRVCLGYALGMLSCIDTIIHFVGKGHSPFHRPRSVPLIIPRMLSWRSVGYVFFM